MPILHFSGKFRNYPPLYNNYPWNQERYFDPQLSPDDVKSKITEKVEPLQYFEFEFSNAYITKITYDDGSSISNQKDDPMIGKEVKLKGLLVDTSPHLERGRLFAAEIRIVDFILAKLTLAVQSDLFRSIRNDNNNIGATKFSANFESTLYDTTYLVNEFVKEENSRFIREVDRTNLKIYFNVNLFYFKSLEGNVLGYLGPSVPIENKNRVRINGRRLLVDPRISTEVKRDFGIKQNENKDDLEPTDSVLRNDFEGSYEIIEEKRLVVLRYFNFIPFLDTTHSLPKGYRFSVALFENKKEIELSSPVMIDLDEDSMSRDGGICIFPIPASIREIDKFNLVVNITKNGSTQYRFMKEPEYDLMLNDNQRFLILGSGKKEALRVRVYQKNIPSKDSITLVLKSEKNDFSPSVVWWNTSTASSNNGNAVCYVEARDLENSKEVEDPILPKLSDKEKPHTISGELPWDRYYGNYLSLKIEYNEKPTIKLNVPVRVLHSVRASDLENIDHLDKEKIQDIVTKMLSYYARYYPWLHVKYIYVKDKDGSPKPAYDQFLKIKEYLNFIDRNHLHDWHSAQETISKINHFLDRFIKDDNDWKKMPRSRDFPINGIEFLKAWKSSIINKVMQDISESKSKIIEDNDAILNNHLDVNNWDEVEALIKGIDNLISSSTSNESKKLLLMCKIGFYEYMLKELSMSKIETKHSHAH